MCGGYGVRPSLISSVAARGLLQAKPGDTDNHRGPPGRPWTCNRQHIGTIPQERSFRGLGPKRKAPAGEMTGALRGSAAIGQAAPGRIRPEHFGGSMASVWPALGSSRDGKPALIALVERLDRKSTFHNGKAPARGDRGEVT